MLFSIKFPRSSPDPSDGTGAVKETVTVKKLDLFFLAAILQGSLLTVDLHSPDAIHSTLSNFTSSCASTKLAVFSSQGVSVYGTSTVPDTSDGGLTSVNILYKNAKRVFVCFVFLNNLDVFIFQVDQHKNLILNGFTSRGSSENAFYRQRRYVTKTWYYYDNSSQESQHDYNQKCVLCCV